MFIIYTVYIKQHKYMDLQVIAFASLQFMNL